MSQEKELKAQKRRVTTSDFAIVLSKTENKSPRFIVSKKIAKKAVDRNRIKRLLRESLKEMKIKGSLTIIARRNFSTLKKQEVEKNLISALKNK